jgi:hypothetical protein
MFQSKEAKPFEKRTNKIQNKTANPMAMAIMEVSNPQKLTS